MQCVEKRGRIKNTAYYIIFILFKICVLYYFIWASKAELYRLMVERREMHFLLTLEVGSSELSYQLHWASMIALFPICKWTDGGVFFFFFALCPHMAFPFVHKLQVFKNIRYFCVGNLLWLPCFILITVLRGLWLNKVILELEHHKMNFGRDAVCNMFYSPLYQVFWCYDKIPDTVLPSSRKWEVQDEGACHQVVC